MTNCLICGSNLYLIGFQNRLDIINTLSTPPENFYCLKCVRSKLIGLFGFEDYRNVLEQIDEIDSLQWKIDTKEINLDIAIKEIVIKNKGKTAGLKFVGEEEL